MAKMRWFDWLAIILLLIGGLNWGLVGFFGFNLVEFLIAWNWLARTIYSIVGIASIFSFIRLLLIK